MRLSSFLDSELIFVNLNEKGKDQIIETMVEKAALVDEKLKKRKREIEDAVLKREHEISTAMGNHIAIPHARIEGYDDVMVIVGILSNDLECETAIHTKDSIKMIFMIIAGQTKNKLVLQLMKGIMKLSTKQDVLKKISNLKDAEKIISIIKDEEIEVSERITAEDVMSTDVEPAKLTDTLEEIAKRFVVEELRGVPVTDNKGKFIGEITQRELIQYGMPKYTSLMGDLGFMTVGEPFEEYFKNEKKVTVKELYRKNPITVDKKASIMEVSFLMVTKGNTRIYVVENGKYYGMILRSDIIKKILHV
ncbi:PTS sugar transporter subunit IIA [Haliovirga abyssi]|uniref:Nitrogen regulatory IIA protein n=1 Tax=Haliovirga abyssi TaxID=2996794 RepID=A0AAU9DG23_9FUSO|nr:PTS sugar transporter subunit IIA [Haliovirga abyssi]BDU49619.1 nitrogen regulatory IIA protein [Haliovirga abyssi]